MKKLLKEFLKDLIPVSFGVAVAFFFIYLLDGRYHYMPKHENSTKIVDTIYIHDTVFIQYQ